jgi:hypothetical protein
VTTLDLTVMPHTGTLTVLPAVWGSDGWRWSERSDTPNGMVTRRAGGLAPAGCYDVTADGASIGIFKPDSSGRIGFSSAGQSGTTDFRIGASLQCNIAAPQPGVRLPLIVR